jgi:TolB-like protein
VIARFDQNGALLWAHTYGGTGEELFYSVAIAPNGDIIAIGYTGSTDGDFPIRHGGADALIASFNQDGDLLWANTYGGSDEDDFYSVAVGANGDIVAVGNTRSKDGDFPAGPGNVNAVVASFSEEGTLLWANTYGGSNGDMFRSVAIAPNGDIVAVGIAASFDGDFAMRYGITDAMAARVSSSGTLLWAKSYGGSDEDVFNGVEIAANSDILAVGYTKSTDGDFAGHRGGTDAVVTRLDASGNLLVADTYGGNDGDTLIRVVALADGDIVTVGWTQSTDGDFPAQHSGMESVIMHVGKDNNLLWAKAYGGNGDEMFRSAAIAANGDIIVVGYTSSADGDFPARHPDQEAVIARFSSDGES